MIGLDAPATILDLFDRVRVAHGKRTALEIPREGGALRVSYDELGAMADLLADLVLGATETRRGTGNGSGSLASPATDTVVALALPRTDPWLYASMLGAMRAGAAYVAIDPAFPARQAADIVADARAVALVARGARAAEIGALTSLPAVIEPPQATSAGALPSAERPPIAPDSLAYVIYTSGTTGRPKGVEIEHRSILNLVRGDLAEFGLGIDDRVAQGSSASYDSSIEEMWLAWAAGGTVVVMDDETARLGPDLTPWLQEQRITVLCPPPTLLRTLACGDPQRALPHVRLLYVGGEALPEDLAELWSRGRRLENGYGPTECSVTCLRATVRGGEPVTIGRAIPGSTAFVIDPDDPTLREITHDGRGELVIGGASLARGYRGQPETTAARFIAHPTLGRVYRTGDLVHRDANGDFHYHGRIDTQVKLRGYRIELGAVEARLAAHPEVIEAACTVEGEGARRRLVAHVVRAADGGNLDALRDFVAEALPPYMVPAVIAPIAAIPRSIGGKIDRRRLPPLGDARTSGAHVAAETELERLVARAIAAAIGRDGDDVSMEADFFDELGLDSLTVAIAISRLRGQPATRAATVRIAYQHRTVRAVARAVATSRDAGAAWESPGDSPRDSHGESDHAQAEGTARPRTATAVQAAFLLVMLVVGAQVLWIPSAGELLVGRFEHPLLQASTILALGSMIIAAYSVAALSLALAAKWTLIGRYRPMRVRAWSGWHVRHWIVVRLAALAPWELLELVGIAPAVLRLFGARIGARVHIHRGVRLGDGGWDLLTLEDDATVGQDACLRVVELDRGCLVLGRVTVRRGATLSTRAGLSPGAELGAGSILTPLSNLRAGSVHAGSILDGVPAQPVGAAPAPPASAVPPTAPVRVLTAALLTLSASLALLAPWLLAWGLLGLGFDGEVHGVLFSTDSMLPSSSGLARVSGAVMLGGVLTVLLLAILVRLLGPAPLGSYSVHSSASMRLTMQSALVEAAGKWLSGTLMWPMWLRLAGAHIGRGCEISTITDVVPSTVRIGAGTFFADGIYLGGPRLHAGTATIDTVELGEGCFVGNHAVLSAGTRLAPGTLLGVSTSSEHIPSESGASWFGHPAFRLPRREVVEMPRELTHDPPLVRRVNRWMWELARFALPIGPVVVGLAWFRAMELAQPEVSAGVFRLVVLPLGVLGALAALCGGVLLLKWLLIGRVRPGTHALWSCWCSRWDFLYVAWGMWASKPLVFLDGTLLLVGYLRAMGCRIGRRALLGSGFSHVVDPDMLRFGDDVTVDALFQAHTFEDRVLKVDHVDLRDGCTVGPNTVILYGADIGRGAQVLPHSVVMKREVLTSGQRFEGAPTQPVGA
jgi:non-ribosomal peptide synthetase-like protein